jgi:pimeloyl-ACP methyl ester carboxylesterase
VSVPALQLSFFTLGFPPACFRLPQRKRRRERAFALSHSNDRALDSRIPDYTFGKIAEDVEELCRDLKLQSVSLFGDGYGGGFAVAAARRLGPAVKRLALHAPNLGRRAPQETGREGLSVFSRQLWIVPAAAELLRKGLRIGVVRSLMSYVGAKSGLDAARIKDRDFDAWLNATVFDALEKTSAGLASELMMFGSGIRSDPMEVACAIAVWHGVENSVVPVSSSVADFGSHPNTLLNILPTAGLFLKQAEFEEIFSWLANSPVAASVE